MSIYQVMTTKRAIRPGIITVCFKAFEYHEVYLDAWGDPVAISRPSDGSHYHVYYHGQPLRNIKRLAFGPSESEVVFEYTEVPEEELQEMVDKLFIDYAAHLMDRRIMGDKS